MEKEIISKELYVDLLGKKKSDDNVNDALNKLANTFYEYDEDIDKILKKSIIEEDGEKCTPSYISGLPHDNRTHDPIKLSERQKAIEDEIKQTDKNIKKLEKKVSSNIHDLERDYKSLVYNTRRIYPRSTKPNIFFDNTPTIEKAITNVTNESGKSIQDQYIKLMNNVGDLYNNMKQNLVGKSTGEPYIIDPWGNREDFYEVPPSSRNEFRLSDDFLQNPNIHENELNTISKEIDNFNKIALNHFGLNSWTGAKGDAKTIGNFAKDLNSLNKTINTIRQSATKNKDKFQSNQKELSSQLKKKNDLDNELNKINL